MLKNGIYNTLGALVRLGLAVLTVPLLTRWMGTAEFGLWILVSSAVGVVALAEAGLSVSTTYFLSRDLSDKNRIGLVDSEISTYSEDIKISLGRTLLIAGTLITGMATVAMGILWLVSPHIVSYAFGVLSSEQQHVAVRTLQVSGLAIWVQLTQQFLVGVEQAFNRYRFISCLLTLHSLILNSGFLWMAHNGGRAFQLMQWQAVTFFITLLWHIFYCYSLIRPLRFYLRWDNIRLRELARYSSTTWLIALGSALFGRADRIFVGAILGSNWLGVYGAITTITGQINAFSAFPLQPLLPSLGRLRRDDSHDRSILAKKAVSALRLNVLISLSMGVFLWTLAPWLIGVMLRDTGVHYILPFRVAIVIYSVYSLNCAGYYILLGIDRAAISVYIQLGAGVLSLILVGLGAYLAGLPGAIWGNSGYLLVGLLTLFAMREIGIKDWQWAQELITPILIFIAALGSAHVLPFRLWLHGSIALAACSALAIWFLVQQRNCFSLLSRLRERLRAG